jgi:S1-C subfamily serine protease
MRLSAKRLALVALAAVLTVGAAAEARIPSQPARAAVSKAKPGLLARRETVAQATVMIPAKSCAGFVADDRSWVVTAAHCIPESGQRFDVKLRNGTLLESTLAYLDRAHDLAALRLDQPAPVEPLVLGDRMPAPGATVLFVGRTDRRMRPQVATIEKIDQCPSLPDLHNALFTTLDAKPGDSGAPLVDKDLRVVGVIHGGARCHISAPTAGLGRELLALRALPAPSVAANPPAPDPSAGAAPDDRVLETYKAGPFVLEKVPNGYKFRFSFSFGSKKE